MADAGFDKALWCENWDGGYKYSRAEVRRIDKLFNKLGIQVTQIHASEGEHYGQWVSPDEKERKKGVDGIRNRIKMAQDLGADVVTVHAPHHDMPWPGGSQAYHESVKRSLGELQKDAKDAGVRIGLENTDWKGKGKFDNFPAIEYALSQFGPDYVGITYDTGHGNLMRVGQGDHIGTLDVHKDRVIDTHLHDNSGEGATNNGKFKIQEGRSQDDDQHRLIFTGTVDWSRLAEIFAKSRNRIPLTSEASMKYDPDMDPMIWLALEKKNLEIFSQMVDQKKAIIRASQNPIGHVLFEGPQK
jgi:sugar phosphate isomerase/epimerase